MTSSRPISQNAQRLLLVCPAIVAVVAMAYSVQGSSEPVAPIDSAPVTFSNPTIADPVLTSVIDNDDALRQAQQAQADEEMRLRMEAEEIARAQAELAALEAERLRIEQQLLEGDPTLLPSLQSSSDAGNGPSNIDFCNNSSTEIRVAMVRSNGAFAAVTRDSWIADGFYTLAPSECTYRNFGFAQSLANGYVSILRKEGGRWVPFTTVDEGDNEGAATFQSHQRSICWPESATAVDPDRSCPDSQNNVQFTHWFGTSGNVYRFRITITDTEVQKFSRQRA
jgi:hypothetical protein